jgi:hypothetical protein
VNAQDWALRIALAIGFLIDASVGLISLFAQPLLPKLLDVPLKDPAMATILGGELLVAAAIYAFPLRDPVRFKPLLWVCALDQLFGVALPLYEIVRGAIPATMKTVWPMPLQLLLVAVYIAGALRQPAKPKPPPLPR